VTKTDFEQEHLHKNVQILIILLNKRD